MLFARTTVIEAHAQALWWIAAALILGAFGVARFMASAAVTEAAITAAITFASLARLGLALLLAAFIVTAITREQNDRVLEVFLTQPIPRATWLAGRMLGALGVALVFALLAGLGALTVAHPAMALPWMCSLALELMLVALAALTAAIALKRVDLSVLAVGLFYVLARSLAGFVGIARSVGGGGAESVPLNTTQRLAELVLSALSQVLPPLDRFAPSGWLAYGAAQAWTDLLGQSAHTVVFAALLAAIAAFDLYRRNV